MRKNYNADSVKNSAFYKVYKSHVTFVQKWCTILNFFKSQKSINNTIIDDVSKSPKSPSKFELVTFQNRPKLTPKNPTFKINNFDMEEIAELKKVIEIQKSEISQLNKIIENLTRELDFKEKLMDKSTLQESFDPTPNKPFQFEKLSSKSQDEFFNKNIISLINKERKPIGDDENLSDEEKMEDSAFKCNVKNLIWEEKKRKLLLFEDLNLEINLEKDFTKTKNLLVVIMTIRNRRDDEIKEINVTFGNSEGYFIF